MDVIIGAGWLLQKCDVPDTSQHESEHEDMARKFWTCKKFPHSQKVYDTGHGQRRRERQAAPVAEVA
jgi:hypothetical protein